MNRRFDTKTNTCRALAATMMLALTAVPAAAVAVEKQAYPSPDLDLPYSAAVRAGDTIYVSGVLGHVRGKSTPVDGGVQAEARQSLAYIKEILEVAGSSMDRVVKCVILLANIDDFPAMNVVYRETFPEAPPARSTIIVPALPGGAAIEIECNALAGK